MKSLTVNSDIITVKNYSIYPGFKKGPTLTIQQPKKTTRYEGVNLLCSFLRCLNGPLPVDIKLVKKTTPTGGEYEVFENV